MKKLVFIFMIAAVLVSCKKNAPIEPINDNTVMQEVTFEVNTILEFTDRAYSVPNCNDSIDGEINKYAEIVIADAAGVETTYFAEIYYVEGLPYTKAILLPVTDDDDDCDSYVLKEFYVWDNMGTPGYDETSRADDLLFKAAPLPGSDFWDFAVSRVEYQFEVCAFEKTKILIDVLCFVPDDYLLFGFFWFEVTEITIREICFFGDFCLKETNDVYVGTEYETSGGGLFIDEPAIFMIEGRHQVGDGPLEDMVGSPWDNMDWLGVGEPLCIQYADYDAEVDYYEFDLYLWAMDGDEMGWVYMYTFTWNDIFEDTYDPGPDGVFEFVVGNCVATETDLLLPPYMNLPTEITMHISYLGYDNETYPGFYWKWKMTYAEPDDGDYYDIPYDTWVGAWCGDHNSGIVGGTHELTQVFCTLDDPDDIPESGVDFDQDLFDQLNYLFNMTRQNGDIDIHMPLTPLKGENMQKAIWGVLHSGDGLNPWPWGTSAPGGGDPFFPAYNMSYMALQHGAGYDILPGGWAGIIFLSPETPPRYEFAQLILILIDP